MIPIFNLIISAIGIFLTSLIFSMFGRGGGEFYLPIMISLLPIDYYTAAGISLFIIMLQGLSMLIVYHGRHRLVDWGLALVLGFAIGLASFLGGYLSYRIPAYLLKLSFSIFLIISAYYLYKGVAVKAKVGRIGTWRRKLDNQEYYVNLAYIIPPIIIAAFTAGMAGISGGGLIIPICILLGGVPIRVAMGTNTFLVLSSASMSFMGHFVRGGFNPMLALIYGLLVVLGSQIGSRMHIKINEKRLRQAFSAILVIASIWMLIKIFI